MIKTESRKTVRNAAVDDSAVIEIRNLCKSFGSNRVLHNFNLTLYKGENVAVLGQSGSGKSVLIKCIVGLIQPDSGSLKVFGKEIASLEQKELDEIREKLGFLFQSNALYDSMTVRENLEFPLRRHRLLKSGDEGMNRIRKALEDVNLLHTLNLMPAWHEPLSCDRRSFSTMSRPPAWIPSPDAESDN